MGVNSLPKTVTRQRRDCNLNPSPSAPESSTLTTRLPSHRYGYQYHKHSSGLCGIRMGAGVTADVARRDILVSCKTLRATVLVNSNPNPTLP